MVNIATEAWKEAIAFSDAKRIIYLTIEIQHPAIKDELNVNVPIRLVRAAIPKNFKIESGALYNPGSIVKFSPAAFSGGIAELLEDGTAEAEVTFDNVSEDLTPYLEEAVKYNAEMKLLFREYRDDSVNGPDWGPVTFKLRNVKVNWSTVSGRASITNLADKKVPKLVYDRRSFPNMQR